MTILNGIEDGWRHLPRVAVGIAAIGVVSWLGFGRFTDEATRPTQVVLAGNAPLSDEAEDYCTPADFMRATTRAGGVYVWDGRAECYQVSPLGPMASLPIPT